MGIPEGFKVSSTMVSVGIKIPALVNRLIAALITVPYLELLDTQQIAVRIDAFASTVRGVATHPALALYRHKVETKLVWGSKKTIIELRKRMKQ